jgi:periplasmic copper chaperone A
MIRVALLFLLLTTAMTAEPALAVAKSWARATAPSAVNGAIFLTLVNTSETEARVTAAASPVAGHVELHGHRAIPGGVEMYRMEAITVPAKGRIDLVPGGMHIMLLGLKSPLKEGTTLTLDLTVGGTDVPLHIEVPVLGIAAMGSADQEAGADCCLPK